MLAKSFDRPMAPTGIERPSGTAGIAPAAAASGGQSVAVGVRLRVLLPLAAAMILLLAVFLAIFIGETNNRQKEDVARTANAVDVMFREQSEAGVSVMRSIIELVLQDRHLEAALRAGDRQALLDRSAPILKEIRARNQITHFYYILPDRTMLLRVQAPDKHGDIIDRFVLQEAQRTGKPFWGNEQGPLGSFTLRVAYPWVSNGEVIGYLEMGIEFEDIMAAIKQYLDVDVLVAIEKKYFDRAKWEEAQRKREQPVPWDEFPSVVVLSRTTPVIPAPIKAYLGALKEQHSKRTFEIAWDRRIAQTIVVPFSNLRQQELGELVVVNDITVSTSERRRAVIWVALLGTAIAAALMLSFYVLLGRVQRDVARRTAQLSEAERVLTIEQVERQRTERELHLQQERNELLEASSRMVEELAAAKEAAEAALRANEKITGELADRAEALQANQRMLRGIIDQFPGKIAAKDRYLRFIVVNSECARALGCSPEEAVGRRQGEFPISGVEASVMTAWSSDAVQRDFEVLESGQPAMNVEDKLTYADGRVEYFLSSRLPMLDAGNAVVGVIAVTVDITAQKQAEAERRTLEQQLHHAQKIEALGQLAGGIAHDLNNALVPILAVSEVVLRNLAGDSGNCRRLELVVSGARRARDLVGQILAFSRREQGARHEFDLAETAAEALAMLRASIPSTITLTNRIGPALPMRGDPGQLRQVLVNLVVNAAQAIDDRQGAVTVEAQHEGDGSHIRLTVSDTGCGMDEDTRQRVFEPFFTTKEVGRGTGLGLSIVHGIVTSHGGTIAVESAAGRGARFDIVLPTGLERACESGAVATVGPLLKTA